VGVAGVVDVDAGGCAAMGVAAVVGAAGVEVVVPAELVEPQPLSRENKETNATRAGT
jgi:hypothetical protein